MSVVVNHISKSYGNQKALDDISFELQEGEICGFLGPNGAGKSTTMKIITGYLTDYQGSVSISDTDIRTFPLKAKAKIGYLPENNPLYPDMYIREYLLHVTKLYHICRPEHFVNEIIALTGLDTEIRKKIGQLSKGYRQRVGLAQALIHQPEVLILDEPTTGLDPNQLEDIRQLIQEVGKNKTVLLSTHIMQEVEAICERVIIINQGRLVADKNIIDIHTLATHKKTVYVRFAPGTDASWLSSLATGGSISQLTTDSWQISSSTSTDIRIELFNQAAAHHCPIIELKTEEHKLEDIFRQLTQ